MPKGSPPDIPQKTQNNNSSPNVNKTLKIKKPPLPKGNPPDIPPKTQNNNSSLEKKLNLQKNKLELQPNQQLKTRAKENLKNKIEELKNK